MSAIPSGATWVRLPRLLGDVAMQLPVLRALRRLQETPLVVWGPAAMVGLVEGTDLADAVLPDEGKPGPGQMASILKRHRAARSVHFPKSLRPAFGAFLARVPERIGPSDGLGRLLNTHAAPFRGAPGHFLDRYAHALASRWPELGRLPWAGFKPGARIERPARPYLCLVPGAGTPAKIWEASHFRALAAMAEAKGLLIVALGSAPERELGAFVAGSSGLNLCGSTSLPEAAAWLAGAAGALGNDSGLCHLAAACGTPVLTLFGATDPLASAPYGPRAQFLRREGVPCSPCMAKVCVVDGHPCLSGLSPETVWSRLEPMLEADTCAS
jgi:heptosyltransferase-2